MAILGVLAAVIAALLTAVLFVFVTYTVYLVIMHRRYAHIPQPKGASFYKGHLSQLSKGNSRHDAFLEWYHESGRLFLVWILHYPLILVHNPESIKELSSPNVLKPTFPALESVYGQRFIKKSLFSIQHYDDWKPRRRAFDPAFARSHLNSLVPVFNKVARDHIDNLRSRADGETVVDMLTEFGKTTLEVISVYARFGKNLSYAESALRVRQIGEYCIRKRLTALENNEEVPHDILTLILQIVQKEENIEMEELVDEFVGFYIGGQETTSNLLSFSLVLLQQHPDVLHRVMEEIEEVVGDKTTVEADDLDKLTYMNQVFQESLRMYPPVPPILKQSHNGMKCSGYSIPEGTSVMVSIYVMHHIPEYYDDPYQFKPSRFDPDQKRPSPYVYMPFGFGYRMCIGKQFALMEAKVLMVHLLKKFHVTLAQDYKLEMKQALTLSPKGGVPCTLVECA